MGSGILAFAVGVLLGGPDGDTFGIYFGESGLILIAIGIAVLFVGLSSPLPLSESTPLSGPTRVSNTRV